MARRLRCEFPASRRKRPSRASSYRFLTRLELPAVGSFKKFLLLIRAAKLMKLRSNAGCQTARGCPALSTFLPKDHTSCRAGKHRSRASPGRFETRCLPKAPATRSPAGDPLFLPLLAQGCEVAEKGCARP